MWFFFRVCVANHTVGNLSILQVIPFFCLFLCKARPPRVSRKEPNKSNVSLYRSALCLSLVNAWLCVGSGPCTWKTGVDDTGTQEWRKERRTLGDGVEGRRVQRKSYCFGISRDLVIVTMNAMGLFSPFPAWLWFPMRYAAWIHTNYTAYARKSLGPLMKYAFSP